MIKKQFIPSPKEFLIKGKDSGFIDVFNYKIDESEQPDHLFMIVQVASDDETLSYTPNLVASFIKREYIASGKKISDFENPARERLEKALKKANELVQDILEDKKVKLNVGCFVVSHDNIHLSRLGKAKLLLARRDECIDVFNNVNLFEKDHLVDSQFTNIVSGKLTSGDKLFFYIPNRHLTAKEESLRANLVSMCQTDLHAFMNSEADKIKESKKSKTELSCCAFHIDFKEQEIEIKEQPEPIIKQEEQERPNGEQASIMPKATPAFSNEEKPIAFPAVNPSEVSKAMKNTIFASFAGKIKSLGKYAINCGCDKRMRPRKKATVIITAIVLILIVAIGIKLISAGKKSDSELRQKISVIKQNQGMAESKIAQGDKKDGRLILENSLLELNQLKENEDVVSLKNEVQAILDKIDRLSAETPAEFFNTTELKSPKNILAKGDAVYLIDTPEQKGKAYILSNNNLTELNDLGNFIPKISTVYSTKLLLFDENKLNFINLDNGSSEKYTLETTNIKNIGIYSDNLYLLSDKQIFKVPDVLTGKIDFQNWSKYEPTDSFVAFSVSKNIFAITQNTDKTQTKLFRLYKGESLDERILEFSVSEQTKLFSFNSDFVIFDKLGKKVRLIDNGGNLKSTYSLNNISNIIDGYFDENTKTFYILSSDKVYKLTISL